MKDELLDAVWAGTVVSDTVLKSCIRELREALGDDAQAPQYIATVHRRGYRFLSPLSPLASQRPTPPEGAPPQSGAEERHQVTRKLAAILSADVCGYSRLMGEDEVATIRTLTAYREMMTLLIHQHHGRVVDSPGDNLLTEFASAVDAVQGTVAIQKALQSRNAELPGPRQMQYRIGINVGDVISEGERLYGEGVNIAARLEGLAEAGGLCISGTVYDQVKSKAALRYEGLGERRVKNIAEPVRVYRVRWEVEGESGAASAPAEQELSTLPSAAHPLGERRRLFPGQAAPVVGREAELRQLSGYWRRARSGARQLVFVTGEPGIGKTTLVERFLAQVAAPGETPGAEQAAWLGRGNALSSTAREKPTCRC